MSIIEDDVPWIVEENMDRLFELFFTAKSDFGNKLGLCVTKEIIERYRGTITVNSQTESGLGGATFGR